MYQFNLKTAELTQVILYQINYYDYVDLSDKIKLVILDEFQNSNYL